jgi:FixJ family two-component response regulator
LEVLTVSSLSLAPSESRPASALDAPGALVFLVDDDASVRRAVARLLHGKGFQVETFADASALLARASVTSPACVLVDVGIPGIDGLELQALLAATEMPPAIVFLSGRGDVRTATDAMKHGAVDFLEKPFHADALLGAVRRAVAQNAVTRAQWTQRARIADRHEALTPREREVMTLVVDGLPNKLVAARIGTTEKTVKVHRARVMTKMGASSLPDLVRMSFRLDGPQH